MKKEIRIGCLVSGSGTNLQAILDACKTQDIQGKVVFVGSDNSVAYGLKRAKAIGIPTFIVDYLEIAHSIDHGEIELFPQDVNLAEVIKKQTVLPKSTLPDKLQLFYKKRIAAEAELLGHISAYDIDLLVLAGFMRTLSPYIIDIFNPSPLNPRIMNIHPALLPAFPGIDGYGDTFRYGCKVGGCTVHFVDYGEDTGPIIGQEVFEISPDDTIESVRKKGLALEWRLYVKCIQLFAQDRLTVQKKRCQLKGGHTVDRTIVEILP
ncbi:MAG: phosphoribosylglycinamide formyltransferase [Pseudomonadota bacterium]